MILFSKQNQIIYSTSLSFMNRKETHIKTPPNGVLNHNKVHLNPNRYQSWTLSEFKMLCLWMGFRTRLGPIYTLRNLQRLDQDDIKVFRKHTKELLYWQNSTIENPNVSSNELFEMYQKKEINIINFAKYANPDEMTRQGRLVLDNIKFYLSHFKKIEEYINE